MNYRTCHLREQSAFRYAGSTSAARDKDVGSGRLGLLLGAGGMAIAAMALIAFVQP